MRLEVKGVAFSFVKRTGPVSVSGRPQPSLTVNGGQPPILMAVLVANTVLSAIVALKDLSQCLFTSDAQVLPLLTALANVRTTVRSLLLWSTANGRHQNSAI